MLVSPALVTTPVPTQTSTHIQTSSALSFSIFFLPANYILDNNTERFLSSEHNKASTIEYQLISMIEGWQWSEFSDKG